LVEAFNSASVHGDDPEVSGDPAPCGRKRGAPQAPGNRLLEFGHADVMLVAALDVTALPCVGPWVFSPCPRSFRDLAAGWPTWASGESWGKGVQTISRTS